jgi:competence protein ComGA
MHYGFFVLFRNQRKLFHRQEYPSMQWTEILETLKFHCGYRLDRRSEFQDGSMILEGVSLRIAFTPFPIEYITIRLHYLNEWLALSSDDRREDFLKMWSVEPKLLIIAGGLHSGKTTQYYDILEKESTLGHSVMSLEDPIEKPMPSFFQLKYHSEWSSQTAAALVRFDTDVVGLGELRRDSDWKSIHFLTLSSIRVITTCHGSSLNAIITKIRLAQLQIPDLHQIIFGVIFLQHGLLPQCVPYADIM